MKEWKHVDSALNIRFNNYHIELYENDKGNVKVRVEHPNFKFGDKYSLEFDNMNEYEDWIFRYKLEPGFNHYDTNGVAVFERVAEALGVFRDENDYVPDPYPTYDGVLLP